MKVFLGVNEGIEIFGKQQYLALTQEKIACFNAKGGCLSQTAPSLIFPGAFNPVHQAHLRMAAIAANRLDTRLTFEISIRNVDKGVLDFDHVQPRIEQDYQNNDLVISNAASFVQKSILYPGTTFVVGADTIARISQTKYYDDSIDKLEAAIVTLRTKKCSFLVFARKCDDKILNESNVELVDSLRSICEFVPESEFLLDLSSTEIRARKE